MSTHDLTQPPSSTHRFVGAVTVSGPNAKGYYRLKWREPDGTHGDTSGGRHLDGSLAEATDIDQRLAQASGPKAT